MNPPDEQGTAGANRTAGHDEKRTFHLLRTGVKTGLLEDPLAGLRLAQANKAGK